MDERGEIRRSDFPYTEEDFYSYSVGERVDLDNDGEAEQILDGPYGGAYFDARDGNVVDEFQLSAEYWDSPEYDENSTFTYRDEEISMEEYEALREEIIGY